MEWLRLHHEIRYDRKLARLSQAEKWQFIVLLILASESANRGVIELDEETICDELETDADGLKMLLHRLERKGIIFRADGGGIVISNWDKRQFSSDDRKEYHKTYYHENRKPSTLKNDTFNVENVEIQNVSTTPYTDTDTKTDTKTEKNTEISLPEIGISDLPSRKSSDTPPKKPKPEPTEAGKQFAAEFRAMLPPERDTTATDLRNWAITFDDLVRLDNRSPEEIYAVCRWARNDNFWTSNFLSATKLRHNDKSGTKYYDLFLQRMKLQSSNGASNGNTNSTTAKWGERSEPTFEQLQKDTERRMEIAEEFRRSKLANTPFQLTGHGAGN